MDRGLYVAASGMMAEMNRQDSIATNLANANTPGYKADRISQRDFAEVLMENRLTGQVIGRASVGVMSTQVTQFTQGAITRTDEPLDVALNGPGFLAVQTDDGVQYTRAGRLTVGPGGILTDPQGRPVLGTDRQPIRVGGQPTQVQIAGDGQVRVNGQVTGQLAVVDLANPRKLGDNLVTGQVQGPSAGTQVLQGQLESSTVDATRTMVDMIASLRSFEAGQRVLRTIDESLGRAAQLAGVQNG